MSDCIFCKIVAGEIPTDIIYEDKNMIVFNDIDQRAPVHVLIVPKTHITSLDAIEPEDTKIIGEIFGNIKDIAVKLGLDNGYRIVNNCGEDALQTVQHVHFHLLGGRKLQWPPG